MQAIDIMRAVPADRDALLALQHTSLRVLGRACYDDEAIEAFIAQIGTMEPDLIEAGTYFAARIGSRLVGCGGWTSGPPSYAGHMPGGGESAPPVTIRSIYVHPDWARRGIARAVMAAVEADIAAAGFDRASLTATLTGVPFYRRLGYRGSEPLVLRFDGGIQFIGINMDKRLTRSTDAALQSAA